MSESGNSIYNLFSIADIPIVEVSEQEALSFDQMILLDQHATDKYHLPIELMIDIFNCK